MALQSTTLFGMLQERIDWLGQRQRVLAQNVANADTSGYAARDLKDLDFKKTLRNAQTNLALDRTDPTHHLGSVGKDSYGVAKSRNRFEVNISGNSVVLEEQMSKVAINSADYQMATRIFTKYKKMHSTALQGKF